MTLEQYQLIRAAETEDGYIEVQQLFRIMDVHDGWIDMNGERGSSNGESYPGFTPGGGCNRL